MPRFWKWFASSEKHLRGFQNNPDSILGEVSDSARTISRGLAMEFEPPKDSIINVTVSADGDRNLFPLVQSIVKRAPTLSGWSFVAFRQRVPREKVKGMVLKIQGFELNPDKMKFIPLVSGDSLDVVIYTNGVTEANFNQLAYGGLLLVDNILG